MSPDAAAMPAFSFAAREVPGSVISSNSYLDSNSSVPSSLPLSTTMISASSTCTRHARIDSSRPERISFCVGRMMLSMWEAGRMNGWPIKAYRCVSGIRLGNNKDRHEKGQHSVGNVSLRV